MIVEMATHELSPGITAISFTGRLVLGNPLTDIEQAIREKIKQGSRKLVLDFSGLNFIFSVIPFELTPPRPSQFTRWGTYKRDLKFIVKVPAVAASSAIGKQ